MRIHNLAPLDLLAARGSSSKSTPTAKPVPVTTDDLSCPVLARMRFAILALLIGCTPAAQTITPAHPAHPDAEPGRLAGPPAALRPGVIEEAPPPVKHDEHAGHGGHEMPAPPSTEKPADSSGLPADSKPPTDAKPPAKKPAKPPSKKPPSKPSAEDPHKGHTMPKPAEPPKPADDPHKGHHGH